MSGEESLIITASDYQQLGKSSMHLRTLIIESKQRHNENINQVHYRKYHNDNNYNNISLRRRMRVRGELIADRCTTHRNYGT